MAYTQEPVSVDVHVTDFWQQKFLFSDLGLAIPGGFATLDKGQSVTTKILNKGWLKINGWKKAAEADIIILTFREEGV